MTRSRPQDQSERELALLSAYAAGDAQAARALVAALTPRALAHATRLLGNRAEAEEVTQEALLRLWRAAPEWRAEVPVQAWLHRVLINLSLDRLRARRSGPPLSDVPEPVDDAPPTAERLQDAARAEALRAALTDLPARQSEAVALRYLQDMPVAGVAANMGITEHAAESLIARGKRTLAQVLLPRRAELEEWNAQ